MIKAYAATRRDNGNLEGLSLSPETLPSSYAPLEVWVVRVSITAWEDACVHMSAGKPAAALKTLRGLSHSMTKVGDIAGR
jgi:hypothetical protein